MEGRLIEQFVRCWLSLLDGLKGKLEPRSHEVTKRFPTSESSTWLRAFVVQILLGHDSEDLLGDVAGVFFGQFRVNRQGEDLAAGALGFRKVSFPVTQVGEACLQVQGDWVIDCGSNAALGEPLFDAITVGDTNDVLVVNAPIALVNVRWRDFRAFEGFVVNA